MNFNKIVRLLTVLILFVLVFSVSAQTKRGKRTKPAKKTAVQTETKTDLKTEPTPAPTPVAEKKNSRPAGANSLNNSNDSTAQKLTEFVYEFTQPTFVISHIRITHDENGKGKITFLKKDFDEEFDDPIQLSAVTLEKLKTHFDALNFLESSEDYQYEKDFSHLGSMKITMRSREGKQRTAAFNWTSNTDAKAITDEYRKIANQYIWMFDITVARENQPLETPRLMQALGGYLRRDGISDPAQMIPFLQDLTNDERVPLITRNNAAKLIKEIEKKKKD